MYIFIAIIFIAELIIAGYVISLICRADKIAAAYNEKVLLNKPVISNGVTAFREGVRSVQTVISGTKACVARKRAELWRRLVNLIVIYIILFILKIRFKKAATLLQYLVFMKECWDSIPV